MNIINLIRPVIASCVVLCLVFLNQAFAQTETTLKNKTITLSKAELSLKETLDELNKIEGMSIVYGTNEEVLSLKIKFPARSSTVQRVLTEIERQAPVNFIFESSHFIVKYKKLEKTYKVSGSVKDASSNEPLVGANVIIQGTGYSTISNADGFFSANLKPGTYTVLFQHLGYTETRMKVQVYQDTQQDVRLNEKQELINSVDVFGNRSAEENLERGRTITTIKSKVLDHLNVNSVNDALLGRINGVWTTKVSGAPGDHYKIRVRGISSIFGCTDPLYVVDGNIVSIVNFENLGIANLNSHDVESITVLKDASSTALYGNLGSNGVVLIETKKGGGENHLNFSVKQGFQDFSKRYPLMKAELFLNTFQYSDTLLGTGFYVEQHPFKKQKYPFYRDSLGNTLAEDDFQDVLFRTGHLSEYQLSGSGSYKTVDYYLSGNYYQHDGLVINSGYEKYSFTANLSKTIREKLTLRLLYKGSHQENKNNLDNYMGNKMILRGINFEPAYWATPDSFKTLYNRFYYNDVTNPSVAILANPYNKPDSLFYKHNKIKKENTNSLNFNGLYQLNKNFTFKAELSASFREQTYSSNIQKSISGLATPSQYMNRKDIRLGGPPLISNESFVSFCQQYEVNFARQFKDHQVNAFVRYRAFKDNAYWAIDSLSDISYFVIKPQDDVFLRGSQAIFGEKGSVLRSINSQIFNLNYNFRKKYFISFITNYEVLKEQQHAVDGQFFNSLALNWDLAKERILHFPGWISAFNLYVNKGKAGNYPLNSLADDLFSSTPTYTANGQIVNTIAISNLANHGLKNEKVVETNYGAELSLFDSRLILKADYYEKTNSGLIMRRATPLYYGGGFIYQNIGEMKNDGLELGLEVTPVRTKSVYWNSRFGYSTNNERVTKLVNDEPIKFNDTDVLVPDFTIKVNEPLGVIMGYRCLGKASDLPQADFEGDRPRYVNAKGLAYLKVDSLNPKTITAGDKTVIGNSIPKFTFNWINEFEYKNFSCEMLWYGSIGVDKYNATKATTYITGTNSEVRNIVMSAMDYHTSNVFYESSYFVEDASFIRLKTLNFSYSPTKKLFSGVKMKYTVSFENLVTLTRYSGYDPESTIYTNNNFSDNAIDLGAYPNPKGVFFSINMTF